jgi:hypothetical protein
MKYSIMILLFLAVLCDRLHAQSNGQPADVNEIIKAIAYHDSIFWEAYNRCDVEKMASYFTDDLEFYHDKGGPTYTLVKFQESMRAGLCGKPDWRLRREAVAGTVKVFPMNNYGGLISGEHVFYINDGKTEKLDGYGKFTQLWKFENNTWKMSRVLSYDHGPAPYINKRKQVVISPSLLKRYGGKYLSAKAGVITVLPEDNMLKIASEDQQLVLYPESNNTFFVKERDVQFEFITEKEKVTKVLIHENGTPVDQAIRK